MTKCKKCDSEIRWKRVGKNWKPLNLDGSEHWEKCKAIQNQGKVYEEKRSGIIHGDLAKPNECDCGLPPWELCDPACKWALNPAQPEEFAIQHLRQI